MGAKLNTFQNMFFNNNPGGINLANNNNLFNNNPLSNNNNNPGTGIDLAYLDNYDSNIPNFQSNNNNLNPNTNANIYQTNPDMNYNINLNMNQIPKGNLINTLPNNNNNNQSPNRNTLNNTLNSRKNTDAAFLGNAPESENNTKKKNIMEGIQQQIQSNKNTKMQDLIKKKMEDQKYLADMNTYNPFGRNGAGAPLRDNSGKIITRRRALISDNKKLNDSIGNLKDDSVNAGINSNSNLHLNSLITNLTQKISAYGTENIGVSNVPRYNSARVAVKSFLLIKMI